MNLTSNRRTALVWLAGWGLGSMFLLTTTHATDIASLRDTLRAGLKCRRDVEFEFVDKVVGLVELGKLPEDLVLNTYRWALGKRDDIPFPYFVEALRRRAALLNVEL